MGRMYSATMQGVAVAAAQDLLEISAPADAIVVLHEVAISQDASETSEQLPFQIHTISGSGSGGSSVTAVPMEQGGPAFGGTVERNNTSRAGAYQVLYRKSENILNGFHYLPTPEGRPAIKPSESLVIGLESAPSASLTMSVTAIFEEVG